MKKAINIKFDGPPSHDAGRFVEVETDDGRSINAGEWINKGDGYWALRITELPEQPSQPAVQADAENCHFSIFSSPENTKEWERGRDAVKDKQSDSPCPGFDCKTELRPFTLHDPRCPKSR